MTVPLPPLDEQHRVVSRLDKVTASVVVREANVDWREHSVKNEWFKRCFGQYGSHRPDFSSRLTQKERGWREVKLKEILTPACRYPAM